MIDIAEDNPVRSRSHHWAAGEQAEYDALKHRGRTLYDNLRTQFDLDHATAYTAAAERHGVKGA